MTDAEFRSLRTGDKVFVSGNQIEFDAVVTGPHTSIGEIPIQVVEVHYRAPGLDYVYQAYRAGYRTTEINRPALLRGWISEGARR
ncbi:MAG TPA: hypothetical protein PK170_01000 [Anaerolineae bacterium]|nr:hypothetical protein [Anaerolineae bacterium]